MTDPHRPPESRIPSHETGVRLPVTGPDPQALWAWVEQLERFAEGGLHTQGFVHELSNVMTAVLGNCELALLGDTSEQMRPDLERVVRQLERVRERIANFKSYVSGSTGRWGPVTLHEALDEALRFLAYPLRKLTPTIQGTDPVLVDLEDDAAIALPHPRLFHALVASIHDFVQSASRFHGPVRVRSEREADRIRVTITQPEGSEPRVGKEYWQASPTGLELPVARGNLERAGGSMEGSAAEGRITLVFPVASPRADEAPDPHAEDRTRSSSSPWSPHRSRDR